MSKNIFNNCFVSSKTCNNTERYKSETMGRRALSMSSFEEVTTFSMHLSTSLPDLTIEDIGSISSTYIFDDKGGGMNENEINKPKIYTEHMIVENLNLICDKNVSNTKGKQQSVMILPDLTLEDTESIASTDVSDDDEDFIEIYEPKTCHTSKEKSFAEILNVSSITGQRKTRPIICGHRGSIYKEPENTLAGFLKAIEIGVDAVEFDVFLLKCGTLVVFHGAGGDENPGLLDDNIGIEGSILDYTAEEARKLSFNSNGEEFGCPKDRIDAPSAFIPTLKEVLEVLKGTGVIAKIELKGPGTAEPVLELVESMEMTDQCHYSSFDHSRIARIRELRPERNSDGTYIYRTGALFVDPPYNFISLSLAVGASEVHLRYDTCTKERVDAIHANGMGSLAWWRGPPGMLKDVTEKYLDVGNEDESMYRVAMKTGLEWMCVNKPDILAKVASL